MKFYRGLIKTCISTALAAATCLTLLATGSSVPVRADETAPTPPSVNDTATLRVSGIEDTEGVTVNAYEIAEQTYNAYGLSDLVPEEGVTIKDLGSPTAAEVSAIASGIREKNAAFKTVMSKKMALEKETGTEKDGMVSYSHKETKAGMYLVLADGVNYLYNPMIVTIGYGDPEDASTIGEGKDKQDTATIDASSSFTGEAWVKRQKKPELDKSIVNKNGNEEVLTKVEDLEVNPSRSKAYPAVTFRISAVVPKYSEQYDDPTFTITDKADKGFDAPKTLLVTGIENPTAEQLANPSGKSADEKELAEDTDYQKTADGNGFTLKLTRDCLQQNRVRILHIEYTVSMNAETTYNEIANVNEATLKYSHSVDSKTTGELKSQTRVYSFEINPGEDKELTKNEKEKDNSGVKAGKVLSGAEFDLFKADAQWNAENEALASATSADDGRIHFSGLAAGNYVLKEKKAPAGYLMSSTIYHISITPVLDQTSGTMTSYALSITGKDGEDVNFNQAYTLADASDNQAVTRNHAEAPFTVKDAPVNGIISTGGRGIGLISALAAGIMAAGVLIMRKNRETKK